MMKLNINLSSIKQEKNREKFKDDKEILVLDRRLQRLQRLRDDPEKESISLTNSLNKQRRRHFEPEVIEEQPSDEPNRENDVEDRHTLIRERLKKEQGESEIEADIPSQSPHQAENQISEVESEDEFSDEESSEEESEDEFFNSTPRIKPVFVPRENRHSIIDQQKKAEEKAKQEELNIRKAVEERRKETLRLIETMVRREQIENDQQSDANFESINSVKTDDESDEIAYLNWKLRELKRNRRDKLERETFALQKEEVERFRNMSEKERIEELKKNPKQITNEREKSKYKFMQKYYHRGAFFMDKEEEVYKRDVAKPTLDDHFDKSVLPKVMQVKNFGRSGQTKYTHLVDQDTTDQSSPWYSKDQTSAKTFFEKHGGGMKQIFERPSKKRKN